MRIAVGSDPVYKRSNLVNSVLEYLKEKGHEIELCGALAKEGTNWADTGFEVAEAVKSGECEEGILFCGTGTGVSIAANKVPGIRCSLCADTQDAEIARKYNHANVIAMGIFRTSELRARRILDTWFSITERLETKPPSIERIREYEKKHLRLET